MKLQPLKPTADRILHIDLDAPPVERWKEAGAIIGGELEDLLKDIEFWLETGCGRTPIVGFVGVGQTLDPPPARDPLPSRIQVRLDRWGAPSACLPGRRRQVWGTPTDTGIR